MVNGTRRLNIYFFELALSSCYRVLFCSCFLSQLLLTSVIRHNRILIVVWTSFVLNTEIKFQFTQSYLLNGCSERPPKHGLLYPDIINLSITPPGLQMLSCAAVARCREMGSLCNDTEVLGLGSISLRVH